MRTVFNCKYSTKFDSGLYTCKKGLSTWCENICDDYEEALNK